MKKNDLVDFIRERAPEYGSIPFWSWNDKLDPEELRRQIRNMHDLGMRGFFMHARGGLETEYMSDEWFDCVKACIDEAKRLGMEAWAYDENGWPSGFAGGRLLEEPDNHAVFVEGRLCSEFPAATDNTLAVYAMEKTGIPTVTDKPVHGCKEYFCIVTGTDSSYVDTMRDDVTEKFLTMTHGTYKHRLGGIFGSTSMPGFFTDEPQYYRWKTPYSRKMEEWFLAEYGYSVKEALPALFFDFNGAEKHRYNYYRLINKKFTFGFAKKMYDWAEENGIKITGHFIEEYSLKGQMECCGAIMPLYMYEHIPGIDYLGRGLRNDIGGKQIGSVCAQTGRKKALTETFACCGWDVTPRELKKIAELQYSGGVNVMCQHLYPYSIRGQRKRDYPAFYSEHSLWQSDMAEFNRYFNNLGAILSMGEECADTLVIHPIHSAWLKYNRYEKYGGIGELDNSLSDLTSLLSGNQIAYHFGDECMMADMASVEGSKIKVGLCEYTRVVIPACDTLDLNTVRLVRELMDNGGKVYTFRHHLPTRIDGVSADLSFLAACEDISDEDVLNTLRNGGEAAVTLTEDVQKQALRTVVRHTVYGKLIYITNLSDKEFFGIKVKVRDCRGLGRMDILTLETSAVKGRTTANGETEAYLDIRANEAVVLYEYGAPDMLSPDASSSVDCIRLTGKLVAQPPAENMLVLDRAYLSLDGENYTELRPIERIRDNLLSERYRGEVTLAFPFYIKDIPSRLEVVTEPIDTDKISVNGFTLKTGDGTPRLDRSFVATDISKYLKIGENRIEMKINYWQNDYVYYVLYGGASETLRNCLVFDTEIENIYLFGNFAIDMKKDNFVTENNNSIRYFSEEPISLIKPGNTLDMENIVTDGYPFYCGAVTFSARLNYKCGDPTVLHLTGRYATAQIEVNGKKAAKLILSEYAELSEYLTEGENTVTVTLRNNYRNLLGPHHQKEGEILSVSPRKFSFETEWADNKTPVDFEPCYSFVRYGIDRN